MRKNNVLKILQIALFSLAAVFMIVAISFCIYHVTWIVKGTRVDASYNRSDNKISYFAGKDFMQIPLEDKLVKFVDGNDKLAIYFDNNNHSNIYCLKSIQRVFPFAGIGFAFIIATVVVTIIIGKKQRVEEEAQEEKEKKEFEAKYKKDKIDKIESKQNEDDDEIVLVSSTKKSVTQAQEINVEEEKKE